MDVPLREKHTSVGISMQDFVIKTAKILLHSFSWFYRVTILTSRLDARQSATNYERKYDAAATRNLTSEKILQKVTKHQVQKIL